MAAPADLEDATRRVALPPAVEIRGLLPANVIRPSPDQLAFAFRALVIYCETLAARVDELEVRIDLLEGSDDHER